jgi:RNA polymerase sigma-70 factor (ECF subfamily)
LRIFGEFDLQDLKTSASECLKIRSDFLRETQSVDSAEFCLDLAAVPGAGKASLAEQVETYYLQHHESLYRFLISVGCPVELVPDLIQEGFCRLFENLRTGKEIERPRSWLVRVLYNLFLNHVRKHKREAVLDESSESVTANLNGHTYGDPEREYDLLQREAQLANAMRQLTTIQLRYLTLRAEGLKFREIGELCGVSTGTVAESCGRALDKLRALIRE